MGAALFVVLPPPPPARRRHVIEVHLEEKIHLVGADGTQFVVRLLEKSGRKARLLLELPDGVQVSKK
jgi:hypothetical protein